MPRRLGRLLGVLLRGAEPREHRESPAGDGNRAAPGAEMWVVGWLVGEWLVMVGFLWQMLV